MDSHISLPQAMGPARYRPYLEAARGDHALAQELYLWGTELAGAWHSHLSHVEVLVRNAMDRRLRTWNAAQPGCTQEWTREHGTGGHVFTLIGSGLEKARKQALQESRRREQTHPRHQVPPNHDDVVAQLTLGAWSRLLRRPGDRAPTQHQRRLWDECLRMAFPAASQDDAGLSVIGSQMETMRILRNRIAHHDNLLQVNTPARLRSSLALLGALGPGYPDMVMVRNTLRGLDRQDPRRRARQGRPGGPPTAPITPPGSTPD